MRLIHIRNAEKNAEKPDRVTSQIQFPPKGREIISLYWPCQFHSARSHLMVQARLRDRLKTTNHGGHWEHREFNDSLSIRFTANFETHAVPVFPLSPWFH